jgi:hypothetical protein
MPSVTAPQAFDQEGEIESNRVTTSQIETTDQTSQRQVAIGPSRNNSKLPVSGIPPPSPARASRPRARLYLGPLQFCLAQFQGSLLPIAAWHR